MSCHTMLRHKKQVNFNNARFLKIDDNILNQTSLSWCLNISLRVRFDNEQNRIKDF